MTPSAPATPATPTEVAELVITWSGFILAGFTALLTVFTVVFVVAGFLGIREVKSIRRTGQQMRRLLAEFRHEVSGMDDRLNTVVEVSYLFNQGQQAYRAGEYETAVEHLGHAAHLDPKNFKVLYRLGRAFTNLDVEVAAEQRLKEARDFGLVDGTAERGLALVYRYSNPRRALRFAREAVDCDANNARNWNCLGLVLRDAGQFDESRQAHERAAEVDRESATTPFYLALLEAHRGVLHRAIEESNDAVHRLNLQERRGKMKPLWADVVRWANHVLHGRYSEGESLLPAIVDGCRSRRRAMEVQGHMDMLLRALRREELRDRHVGPIEVRWPPRSRNDG